MRIDGLTPSAAGLPKSGGDVLSKLNTGDNIRAQIVENSGNELTLKLSDGSKVTAAAMSPVEAKEGEFVTFTYKGTVEGKPAFEVAQKSTPQQTDKALENIKTTLTSLKLPLTDENINLAKALTEQNQPITAENMTKMTQLVSTNQELKPNAAAFLTASNLSVDPNNIEKLQNLLAGRLKLGNDIAELVKLVNGGEQGLDTALSTGEAGKLLEKLAAQLSAKVNGGTEATADKTVIAGSQSAAEQSDTVKAAAQQNTALSRAACAAVEADDTATAQVKASGVIGAQVPETVEAENNSSTNTAGQKNTTVGAEKVEKASAAANQSEANSTKVDHGSDNAQNTTQASNKATQNIKTTVADVSTKQLTNQAVGSSVDKSAASTNDNQVKNLTQSLNSILKGEVIVNNKDLPALSAAGTQLDSMINSGKLSQEELAAAKLISKQLYSIISKLQTTDSNQQENSVATLKFEAAVHKINNLYIKIDKDNNDIDPVKLYKEMNSTLHELKSAMQQLSQSMREAAGNIVNNMESNLNFINQLNNYSSYVQLPLSIFNQNSTGELYMLKKGSKNKKLDPSNMTVLISLDTNNIGRIDTLLSVDKMNISTNFRLENDEVFPILKESHKELYNSLLKKGFRLVDFTYRRMDEPLSIVNFEAEAKKEFIKSTNNIDITI